MNTLTSVSDEILLQPALTGKHRETAEWMSVASFWKRELDFFQKLLDQHASTFISVEDKKKIDHFQSLITYYRDELINGYSTRLRLHEKRLSEMLKTIESLRREYDSEHEDLTEQLAALSKQFDAYHDELFSFIERVVK